MAEATVRAIRELGGESALQLTVAKKTVDAYVHLARTNNTMIVQDNMTEVAS